MPPDQRLLEILRRHGVPFVAIGGHAVIVHGFRRATEDTDVVWLRSPKSERILLGALSEMEAKYIGKEIDRATGIEKTYPVTLPFIQQSHLMMLWTDLGFLDLFDYIPGMLDEPVEKLFEQSLHAGGLHYASLEHLKAMKRAANRDKDRKDLAELNKLKPE
jgi:hypothetical protein